MLSEQAPGGFNPVYHIFLAWGNGHLSTGNPGPEIIQAGSIESYRTVHRVQMQSFLRIIYWSLFSLYFKLTRFTKSIRQRIFLRKFKSRPARLRGGLSYVVATTAAEVAAGHVWEISPASEALVTSKEIRLLITRTQILLPGLSVAVASRSCKWIRCRAGGRMGQARAAALTLGRRGACRAAR